MVIGIDIRVLGSKQRSGVQEYADNLLAAMLPLDPSIQYKLFYASSREPVREYPWFSLPNVRLHSFKISNQLLFYASRIFDRPHIDKMLGGVDVFFSPHFILTSLSPRVRRVTTFHDLSFEQFPEFFSWKRWLWHQFVNPSWQARFSDNIITVSESTKHDLAHRYHIDPARIVPIHSGVSNEFSPLPPAAVESFKQSTGLPSRYILFLGTMEPRKNIGGLLKAFEGLKKMPGYDDLHLVIAGSRGWLNAELDALAKGSPAKDAIHFEGSFRDSDRALFYNGAELFVYPSFFEGFGFPPLEAMACGTPVIASSTSSLPEVVGNAGILVNPYHVSDLTLAMHAVLSDETLKRTLIQRGFERAKEFSWRNAAETTLQVLTRA